MENSLTPARRRELRAAAHHLHPVVAIGQHGLTPAVLHEIDVALKAHELVKLRVSSGDRAERDALFARVCEELAAAPVQHLGKVLILWREQPAVEAPARKAIAPGRAAKPARPRSGTKAGTGKGSARRAPRPAGSAPAGAGRKSTAGKPAGRKPAGGKTAARKTTGAGKPGPRSPHAGAPAAARKPGARAPVDGTPAGRAPATGPAGNRRAPGGKSAPRSVAPRSGAAPASRPPAAAGAGARRPGAKRVGPGSAAAAAPAAPSARRRRSGKA